MEVRMGGRIYNKMEVKSNGRKRERKKVNGGRRKVGR